jgi:hypothetical protein
MSQLDQYDHRQITLDSIDLIDVLPALDSAGLVGDIAYIAMKSHVINMATGFGELGLKMASRVGKSLIWN